MLLNKMCRQLSLVVLLAATILSSCNQKGEGGDGARKNGRNDMADLNRYLVTKDRERIMNYIERKGLHMTETSTGLWYQIVNEGKGPFFREKDRIVFDYECSLLDGTKCYSSASVGPKELVLGRSEIEAGLNEGLRLLKPGSEAIFIIPPFLAWGLVGDRKMIPPRSVIVYRISVHLN